MELATVQIMVTGLNFLGTASLDCSLIGVVTACVFTANFFRVSELEQADKDQWEQFVSGKLAEINKRNSTDLVSLLTLLQPYEIYSLTLIWCF